MPRITRCTLPVSHFGSSQNPRACDLYRSGLLEDEVRVLCIELVKDLHVSCGIVIAFTHDHRASSAARHAKSAKSSSQARCSSCERADYIHRTVRTWGRRLDRSSRIRVLYDDQFACTGRVGPRSVPVEHREQLLLPCHAAPRDGFLTVTLCPKIEVGSRKGAKTRRGAQRSAPSLWATMAPSASFAVKGALAAFRQEAARSQLLLIKYSSAGRRPLALKSNGEPGSLRPTLRSK